MVARPQRDCRRPLQSAEGTALALDVTLVARGDVTLQEIRLAGEKDF